MGCGSCGYLAVRVIVVVVGLWGGMFGMSCRLGLEFEGRLIHDSMA